MLDEERIRRIEEAISGLPAQWGTSAGASSASMLVTTMPPPNDSYPTSGSKYYAQSIPDPSFVEDINDTTGIKSGNGTPKTGYIYNVGNGYIPSGTTLIVWEIGGQWYADYVIPQVFYPFVGQCQTSINPQSTGPVTIQAAWSGTPMLSGGGQTAYNFRPNHTVSGSSYICFPFPSSSGSMSSGSMSSGSMSSGSMSSGGMSSGGMSSGGMSSGGMSSGLMAGGTVGWWLDNQSAFV